MGACGIPRAGRLITAALALWLAASAGVFAQDDVETPRYRVEGARLFFDTTVLVEGKEEEIGYDDLDALRDILRANDAISILEINSTGGGHYPSMDIAALVIDFELDTHVQDVCESSCVTIFLGGQARTMARGARIGFHQLSWNARSVEDYYNKHRERRDWASPFEFSEWLYRDTQTETFNRLTYMVQRGVDAHFAIRTLRKPDTTMWFPYRAVLRAAGVLTE